MRFTITPVLFNVGINEKASIAEKLGQTGPQEKNNSDNFRK
jgi:inositol polyphosphate-4-phosphatase